MVLPMLHILELSQSTSRLTVLAQPTQLLLNAKLPELMAGRVCMSWAPCCTMLLTWAQNRPPAPKYQHYPWQIDRQGNLLLYCILQSDLSGAPRRCAPDSSAAMTMAANAQDWGVLRRHFGFASAREELLQNAVWAPHVQSYGHLLLVHDTASLRLVASTVRPPLRLLVLLSSTCVHAGPWAGSHCTGCRIWRCRAAHQPLRGPKAGSDSCSAQQQFGILPCGQASGAAPLLIIIVSVRTGKVLATKRLRKSHEPYQELVWQRHSLKAFTFTPGDKHRRLQMSDMIF